MPFAMTVTAQQGGSVNNGIRVAVKVLTGAAALQNGATATQSCDFSSPAAHQAALTTTVTGSQVYGALVSDGTTAFTANGATTLAQDTDSTNSVVYADCRTTSATGTPGSVTVGASAPSTGGGCALAEILSDGTTLTEDPSAPAVALDTGATQVTTAAFAPPGGALLVAQISAAGGGSVETMTVFGGGVTWTPLAEANAANGSYAGVWIAVASTPGPGDPIITATQGGSSANRGVELLVKVLTGAVEAGGAPVANFTAANAIPQGSLTPNFSQSLPVFGLSADGTIAGCGAAAANNTYWDNSDDATDLWSYAHGFYSGTVTAGTPLTFGSGALPGGDYSVWACYEVPPSVAGVSPVVDASGPALASTETLTAVSTVNFTPPTGAVLVAIVVAGGSGAGAGMTMAVTGGGLTWTQRAAALTALDQPVFIFTATVPPATVPAPPALPGPAWRRRFHHPQTVQQAPPPVAAPAGTAVFTPPPPRRAPRRASLGARGALAAGILAAGIGPPAVPAPHQAPAITHPSPHRAAWRSGQGAPPGVTPGKRYPVTVFTRAPHRVLWHGASGQPPNAVQQVKVPPTVFTRRPHGALWRSGRGAAPAALPQLSRPATVYTRAPHRALWRSVTGTAAGAVLGTGTPQPSRPVTVFSRKPHGASWRGGAGPPPVAVQSGAPQPSRPATVYRRVPHGALWKTAAGQPPAAARQPRIPGTVFTRSPHRAAWRSIAGAPAIAVQGGGTAQPFRPPTVFTRKPHGAVWRGCRGAVAAAQPQPSRPVTVYRRLAHGGIWRAITGRPAAATRQPRIPVTVFARLRHGAIWRAGAGSPAAPPPPFTIGTLTASGAPASTLTAAQASSALTAATAGTVALTAATQTTGGPS